jgi:hypothetical protein
MKLVISLLISQATALNRCPTLACNSTIGDNVCYLHSATSPVDDIKVFKCPSDQWCNVDTSSMAWVDFQKQQTDSSSTETKS